MKVGTKQDIEIHNLLLGAGFIGLGLIAKHGDSGATYCVKLTPKGRRALNMLLNAQGLWHRSRQRK